MSDGGFAEAFQPGIFDVSQTLDCGDTRCHIYERGGVVPVRLNLPWTACDWNRRVDEYSTGAIELQGLDCFALYDFIEPRRHELVIERTQDGIFRRIWAGPIYGVSVTPAYPGLRVSAHDLSWWLTLRKFHADHTWNIGTDLVTVFIDAINDGLSVDNSFGMTLDWAYSGSTVTEDDGRKVVALGNDYVYDYVKSLADAALDWTVIDRVLTVRGFELTPTALNPLTEQHFILLNQFTLSAKNAPTRVSMSGNGRGEAGDTVVGTATTTDPTAESIYGVVEQTLSDPTIRDVGGATVAAQNRMRNFNGKPRWIFQGGDLDLNRCPITLPELVPGRRLPLAIGQTQRYPTIQEVYRLTAVDGYVGPDQNKVSISVAPLGATNEDLAEE